MVNRKMLLAPTSLFVALSVALTFAINPVADAASKKTLKLLWSDEFNAKKGSFHLPKRGVEKLVVVAGEILNASTTPIKQLMQLWMVLAGWL